MALKVSSAEFLKAYGRISEAALKEPVSITSHGRERLVLISADEFRRLKANDASPSPEPAQGGAARLVDGVGLWALSRRLFAGDQGVTLELPARADDRPAPDFGTDAA